jgi:Mg2+/Co2+ transporter CorC
VGGLVSEIEGRIPLTGEVVILESAGLRLEVVASTDRRVDRVRVFPPAHEENIAQQTRPGETHDG